GFSFPIVASQMSRTYPSVTSALTGQDFQGVLGGDTTGSWNPAGPRPVNGPERNTAITAPTLVAPADSEVLIPVNIQGVADTGVIAYQFDLHYDPSVIQPQANSVDLTNTVSRGLSVVANPATPGVLRVVVYGPLPVEGNGVLLNLRFTAVGAPGSVSPLTW